ncbi:MAG: HD domain-containing phosphohydrolase [Pseudomonadota bacterium]|nr:HD domain-containing phosphohydrolase [Pseudomonadota bacterium]
MSDRPGFGLPAPLRIAGLYGLFGVAWILGSDSLLESFRLDPRVEQTVQTFKGLAFIALSVLVVLAIAWIIGRRADSARDQTVRLAGMLRDALGSSGSAAFRLDSTTGRFEISAGVRQLLGIQGDERATDWQSWLDLIHPDDRALLPTANEVSEAGRLSCVLRLRTGDNGWRWFRLQAARLAGPDDDHPVLSGTIADISDIQASRENAERTVWLLGALIRANRATLTAGTEDELFAQVCAALTADGRFSLAWIGLARHDAERTVAVAATSGPARGFIDNMTVYWNPDRPEGNGLIGRCIRSGVAQVAHDVTSNPAFAIWRTRLEAYNFTSCIAVPIPMDGETAAVLAVYGTLPQNFDADAQAVIANVGEDIGFALSALRHRARLAAAERAQEDARRDLAAGLLGAVRAVSTAVEMRDPYTAGHQGRVADLAAAIATEMDLPANEVEEIRLGAMIHDVGKIRVPAEILTRPGRLSVEEFDLVKRHPEHGYEIVRHIGLPDSVTNVVLQHHERMDGRGYPAGLRGDQIALSARIVAVADIVEAMAAHRPYRGALGMDRSIEEVRRLRGTALDAGAVDACMRVVRRRGFEFRMPPRDRIS